MPLDELRGDSGFQNLAGDINRLRRILRASWPQIVGKSPLTLEDLRGALQLVPELRQVL
jgi:hypothetical protein